MGVLEGHRQVQIYVEDGLWEQIGVLATKLGLPLYKVINAAIHEKLHKHFTAAELRALQALLTKSAKRSKKGLRVTARHRR